MILEYEALRSAMGFRPNSADAALLSVAHVHAERLIKEYVWHEVERQPAVTEYLPRISGMSVADGGYGWGLSFLLLRHVPIRSVASVAYDLSARFEGAETLCPPASYRLSRDQGALCTSGMLYPAQGFYWPNGEAAAGFWPTNPGCVRVVYDGGWTAAEIRSAQAGPFQMAVYQASMKFFNELKANSAATVTAGTGAVASEQLGGQSIQYARAADNHGFLFALPPSVLRMLEPHVHMGKHL